MVSPAEGATAKSRTVPTPPPTANTTAAAANMVAFGHKISSVVPGTATAEGVERRFSGMDLALKLHYIRGVYLYAASEMVAQTDIQSLKAPMFTLLNAYYPVSGRIRSGNKFSDRPFLKCNDCGVRIIEAKSDMQIHQLVNDHSRRLIKELEPQQVIGPRPQFSPLVFIQFTWFKCGGLAIGFSWPHVLGDAVSVARFFDAWANLVAQGKQPRLSMLEGQDIVDLVNNSELQLPSSFVAMESHQPVLVSSIKQVDLTTDSWVVPAELQNKKMETLTFNITEVELDELLRKIGNVAGEFEAICAVIWKCLVNVRANDSNSVVTICRPASKGQNSHRPYLGNRQTISTVQYTTSIVNFSSESVGNTNLLSELVLLVAGEGVRDETQAINDHVDAAYDYGGDDVRQPHYVLYGTNLTFVDMEKVDCYDLKLKGQAPILVNYDLFGIGDAGVVVVLPGLPQQEGGAGNSRGRVVNVKLPANEIVGFRGELAKGGYFGHTYAAEKK